VSLLVSVLRYRKIINNCIPVQSVPAHFVDLGCLLVIVLATGPKVRGLKPAEDDVFLRAIKICSLTSFGGEEKPSAPCHKILRHVKDPCGV
jgi:hypothetical protein